MKAAGTLDSLVGTSVVVVGGSSGMGLATACLASRVGARVTIAARDPDRLASAVEIIGGDVRAVATDVTDESAVRLLFDAVGRVDHVAFFAGAPTVGSVVGTDPSELRPGMEVRFWGAVHVCRHAVPAMPGQGSVTLCSGVAAERPMQKRSVGAASTAAVEALARAMAIELAPIRVNAVRPGAIDTTFGDRLLAERRAAALAAQAERLPLGRIGQPEEVGSAVLFLMTSPYVTGVALTIDGGYLLA